MLRFSLTLALFVLAFLSLNCFAQTVVTTPATTTEVVTTPTVVTTPGAQTQRVIVTPVPKPKEVVVTPSGFVNCFTVKAGWFGNEWIPEHQVCQYENQPGKVAWVEGYWACTKYRSSDGVCTSWDWRPGRWVETLSVY